MSRCIPYGRLLSLEEGLLPVRERRAVQAHVDRCVRCRRELDRIEKMIELIEENPGEELVRTPKRLLKSALTMIPVPEKQESPAPKPSGATEGLRRIVARWITPSIPQPVLARSPSMADTVKSDSKRSFGLYEAEGFQIALSIKRRNNGQSAILGELFPETSSGNVTLSLRGGIGSRKAPLEASRFGFYDVQEGEYLLRILCGEQVIEIGDVVVA